MKTDSRTERELIEQAQDDLDAFGELVERYRNSIQRQCFSRVRDHQHAEDLAQEAFIRAYLNLDQLSEPDFFPNWLRKIASNVCNEFLRSPARRESATDLLPEQVACAPTTALSLGERELPDETRACIDLFYNSGLSYSEIADRLHTTVKSVKGRLSRARAVLREELAEMEPRKRSPFTQRVLDTLKELEGDDEKARKRAASELHHGLAPDRIDTALGWLSNPDPLERSYAIRVSRKYRSPRVRDRLVDILLHDEWEENRLKAAHALVAQRDPSVIPHLERAMADPCNPSDVKGAAKSAIKQLQTLQPSSESESETLGFRQELLQATEGPEARGELLKRLINALGDSEPAVRKSALKSLQQLGDKRAVPAIAKLLDCPRAGLHQDAARALGELGGKRAFEALVGALEQTNDRSLLQILVRALAQIGDRAALPTVLSALNDKVDVWRRNGVFLLMAMEFVLAIAQPSDRPAIDAALNRLAERTPELSPHVAHWRARVLALLGDQQDIPELANALAGQPTSWHFAHGLARIGGDSAIAILREQLLSNPSDEVAAALVGCGTAGENVLREALRHRSSKVRLAACSGIWSRGPVASLQHEMEELSKSDPNGSVRLRAKVALRYSARDG